MIRFATDNEKHAKALYMVAKALDDDVLRIEADHDDWVHWLAVAHWQLTRDPAVYRAVSESEVLERLLAGDDAEQAATVLGTSARAVSLVVVDVRIKMRARDCGHIVELARALARGEIR